MVTYTCKRCNYTTDHKTKFTRHQNRKNKCKNINKNNIKSELPMNVEKSNPFGHPTGHPDDQKYTPKNRVIRMTVKSYPKYTPNEDVLKKNIQLLGLGLASNSLSELEQINRSKQKISNLQCRYCKEIFTQKQNRWRHEKYRCALNPSVIKSNKNR